jgi:hypothetical protein
LGQAYFRQSNYPKAVEQLIEAVELYGAITDTNAPFYNMLGQAYIRDSLDNCSEAVPLFQEVLTVNSLAVEDAEDGIEECRRAGLTVP